jgi:hypothetical protein
MAFKLLERKYENLCSGPAPDVVFVQNTSIQALANKADRREMGGIVCSSSPLGVSIRFDNTSFRSLLS